MRDITYDSTATIISFRPDSEAICAGAARISTTEGDALAIYKRSLTEEREKNNQLIRRVLGSGHKSFIEHGTMTIAFCNVSVFVEQFMIEFRLASFTIKSRRYVNFGNMGYYVPEGMAQPVEEQYRAHMEYLFSEYNAFIGQGVPKEDARFVLPYCFYSNFYCTVNARELIYMLQEMLYGRGSRYKEIVRLAGQLCGQLETLFPELLREIRRPGTANGEAGPGRRAAVSGEAKPHEVRAYAELFCCPVNPGQILCQAYQCGAGLTGENLESGMDQLIDRILYGGRPRELEQLVYTYQIRQVSLSGITHIARHRMQSIIIPSLDKVRRDAYIIPDTVRGHRELLERYEQCFQRNLEAFARILESGYDEDNSVYFNLSGNTLDLMTTMNAREMITFFKLRCCNRAQWEVRAIAEQMRAQARDNFPQLFGKTGPSCVLENRCPEGRLACGEMAAVRKRYKAVMEERDESDSGRG